MFQSRTLRLTFTLVASESTRRTAEGAKYVCATNDSTASPSRTASSDLLEAAAQEHASSTAIEFEGPLMPNSARGQISSRACFRTEG